MKRLVEQRFPVNERIILAQLSDGKARLQSLAGTQFRLRRREQLKGNGKVLLRDYSIIILETPLTLQLYSFL